MTVRDVYPATAGFTAVLCGAGGCGFRTDSAGPADATEADRTAEMLRAVVRSSRHGVLVSTGCLLGPTTCRLRTAAPLVLVQPCDAERRPMGPAVHVGPLRSAADVRELECWLRRGRFDPALLPGRLLEVYQRAVAAPTN